MALSSSYVTAPANADSYAATMGGKVNADVLNADPAGKALVSALVTAYGDLKTATTNVSARIREAKDITKGHGLKTKYGKLADKIAAEATNIEGIKTAVRANYRADAAEYRLNNLEKTVGDIGQKIG